MTGKREQTKQRNRAVILQSARQCFLENGYNDVTVRDIIRETGLASGTFYNYFEDKPAVFNALLDEVFTSLNARLSVIRRSATTAEELIRFCYQLLFQIIDDDPKLLNFALNSSPTIQDLNSPLRLDLTVAALEADLKRAAEAGLIPGLRLDYLAAYLFGQGLEVARMYAAKTSAGQPSEAETLTKHMAAIGYQGLCAAAKAFQTEKAQSVQERQVQAGQNATQQAKCPA
ncbi:MAG: AcrR family transcriptional regulator [Gammaproteobacteria bacterium]|jgi:AcrR family transcriptional regulator